MGLEEIASDVQAHMDFCRSTLKLCLVVIHRAALQLMRSAMVTAMLLGLVSCTLTEEHIRAQPATFAPPVVDPIQLKIAYSYGPDVDKPVPFVALWAGHGLVLQLHLTAATRSSFDMLFPALFTEATPGAPRPGQAGAIRVDIAAATTVQASGVSPATVIYTLTFLDPDGSLRATWRVGGRSALPRSAQVNLTLAVREAAARVAHDMGQQPAVRAWLVEAQEAIPPKGVH